MQQPAAPAAQVGDDPHAGHGMRHGIGGTGLPAGTSPPPPPPRDHYADRSYDAAEMARARAALKAEHGGMRFTTVTFNLAEYRARKGGDGYRWDGELWHGGDINRFVLRTEGEGRFEGGVGEAEFQALYSRALDAYWNLQAGVRVDAKPNGRAYAVVGFEGLAPYWFDVESALFLSERGDLFARVQASYDQRITNRLILQPWAEVNVAAKDVPRDGIGSGLSDLELGLRLRYEFAREFAPYIGISYDRAFGDTARYARAAGEDPGTTAFVLGVRTWF
jgi:copper resistance protein B